MKIHKGDTVLVVSGKDKGAKGKVLKAYPDAQQGARRGRQPDQEAHPDFDQPARLPVRRHRHAGGARSTSAT